MNIITQLVEFILLKREVKDIEYDPSTAKTLFVAYVGLVTVIFHLLNTALLKIPDSPVTHIPLVRSVIESAVFLGLFYCFFAAREKQARFTQATTALYGSALILLAPLPLILWLPEAAIFFLLLIVWYWVCKVRVAIQSLDYTPLRATLSLLGIVFMSSIVADLLFPLTLNEAALSVESVTELAE